MVKHLGGGSVPVDGGLYTGETEPRARVKDSRDPLDDVCWERAEIGGRQKGCWLEENDVWDARRNLAWSRGYEQCGCVENTLRGSSSGMSCPCSGMVRTSAKEYQTR